MSKSITATRTITRQRCDECGQEIAPFDLGFVHELPYKEGHPRRFAAVLRRSTHPSCSYFYERGQLLNEKPKLAEVLF